MTRRLYLLPFDHRETFARKLLRWEGPLSPHQVSDITAVKNLIYDGFLAAVANGVPKAHAAILVDERFGAAILRDAAARGYMTACPVERSGQKEFAFEFGEDFGRHISTVNATFCKVLVRYNPQGDSAMNRRQTERLKRLSDHLVREGRLLMFELLVPAEPAQLLAVGGHRDEFDSRLRPGLTIQAIHELQASGIEPNIWKVEGTDRRADYVDLVAAARRGGRDTVDCIVLGRGENASKVRSWLTVAATVPGFIGFAVGRTTFWDALVDWRAGRITRDAAVEIIAHRYQEWADIFERQAIPERESDRVTIRALRRWENEGGRL
jgi:myo-inositol catabolism protein IolC